MSTQLGVRLRRLRLFFWVQVHALGSLVTTVSEPSVSKCFDILMAGLGAELLGRAPGSDHEEALNEVVLSESLLCVNVLASCWQSGAEFTTEGTWKTWHRWPIATRPAAKHLIHVRE